MKEIKVVSILVTFNGARWIRWCLNALISSDLPSKIVIIDNNSTDSTKTIIKSEYPQINLVESEENLGFGKANNIGLKIALDCKPDFVFLLNQDVKVEADTIRKLVIAQMANNIYGVVSPIHLNGCGEILDNYFSRYLISGQGGMNLISHRVAGTAVKDIYPIRFVNAASWLISRKCIDTVGGFDPLFQHYGEDNNYLHRVHYHGFKVGVIPNAKMYHDRENRDSSERINPFHRELDVFRRSLLINSIDLNKPINTTHFKKYLRYRVLKCIFRLNKKNTLLQIDILKEYSSKVGIIHEHYKKSKRKGRTFL